VNRYLADENIPAPTIQALRAAGFDVAAVSETAPSATDDQVLTLARDQGRILLSFDLDMGGLIFERRLPAPAGVMLIRYVAPRLSETTAFIVALLQRQDLVFDHFFTVVTRERIRQRPLPSDS
jgi:predicted nuclease of predicted toxin-antitoxin system